MKFKTFSSIGGAAVILLTSLISTSVLLPSCLAAEADTDLYTTIYNKITSLQKALQGDAKDEDANADTDAEPAPELMT